MTYFALFLWPVVVILLFRRFSRATAIAISVIGGYLLLPTLTEIRLPLIPDINKNTVAALPAMFVAMYLAGQQNTCRLSQDTEHSAGLPGWVPRQPIVCLLLFMVLSSTIMTALTNTDPVIYGFRVLRGVSLFDGMSALLKMAVTLVPFLLARKFLCAPDDQHKLLLVLCCAGLAYSMLALWEIRMSPQLNRNLYGFFPHDWSQHKRGGGWRPIVFLQHGLWLGIFFTCTAIAAAALIRIVAPPLRVRIIIAFCWLFMTLFLSKTLGAFMIAVLILPALFFPVRMQLIYAAVASGCVLFYPALRAAGLTPVYQITEFARGINESRAASFETRLRNEDALLEKAQRRALFGWGGWSRARVFNDEGEDTSVTDGFWIILVGEGGWFRYLGVFGLMAVPTIILAMRKKAYEVTLTTSALCLILTANLIDLIPNATITPVTWLIAGALAGRLEVKSSVGESPAVVPRPIPADRRRAQSGLHQPDTVQPVYTRQKRKVERSTSVPSRRQPG